MKTRRAPHYINPTSHTMPVDTVGRITHYAGVTSISPCGVTSSPSLRSKHIHRCMSPNIHAHDYMSPSHATQHPIACDIHRITLRSKHHHHLCEASHPHHQAKRIQFALLGRVSDDASSSAELRRRMAMHRPYAW